MRIAALDHLVLTVRDLDPTIAFYEALGMRRVDFGDGRVALAFGAQKINLHIAGREFLPKATRPTPGSGDICLLVEDGLDEAAAHLEAVGIVIEEGPVARTGARGPLRSLYVRDPDGNLVELSEPL